MSLNHLLAPNVINLYSNSITLGKEGDVRFETDNASDNYALILPSVAPVVDGQVLQVSNSTTGQLVFSEGLVNTEVYNSLGYMNAPVGNIFVNADKDKYYSFMINEPVGAQSATGTSTNPDLPVGHYKMDVIVDVRKISGGSNVFNFNLRLVNADGTIINLTGLVQPTLTSIGQGDLEEEHWITRTFYFYKNNALPDMALIWENTTSKGAVWDSWQVPYYNIVITKMVQSPETPPA